MDKVNGMNEKDLERMGSNFNEDDKDDQASIITQDKLKQFNEIYGFEGGPAVNGEVEEDQDIMIDDEMSNPNEGDEKKDEVHSLRSKALRNTLGQKKFDADGYVIYEVQ
jgi:hypothetical protein